MLAAGLLEIRRLPGVMRPAIAVPIPARDGPSVLLDCGANADARAEHLVQFAHMGAVYARYLLGAWVDRLKIPAAQVSPALAAKLATENVFLVESAEAAETDRTRYPVAYGVLDRFDMETSGEPLGGTDLHVHRLTRSTTEAVWYRPVGTHPQ